MHTVNSLIFKEQLVVFRDGDKEEDGGDVLEAVYPFLSLRSLASNVEHTVGELADDEGGLSDASSLDSRSKYILVVGEVVGLCDAADGVEVTKYAGQHAQWTHRIGCAEALCDVSANKLQSHLRCT